MKHGIFSIVVLALLSCEALADPLAPEDRMQFADGLYARELYDLASQEYSTLIKDSPTHDRVDAAYYRLGDCYRHMGKSSEAQRQYSKVFKDFPKSEFRLKAGVKRADIFVREGRYQEGVDLYRIVLKRKPGEPIGSACHYFIGEALLELGRTNDAKAAYSVISEKLVSSDYYPFALLRLADIASQAGERPELVLKYYRAAVTNNVSQRATAEALYQVGRLEFTRKKFEASSRAFADLARRFPDDQRTKDSAVDAAWAQFNAGFTAKSLKLAGDALTRNPDAKSLSGWLYLKANCERALQKHDDAIKSYSRLIEQGGSSAHVYSYERGLCHFAKGEYRQVASQLDGLEKHADIRQDVLWLLARSSRGAGDVDSAVQYYRKIRKEFPKGPFAAQAVFRLAEILRERKDWKSAAELYHEVSAGFPKDELAEKALFAEGVCHLSGESPQAAISAWKLLSERYPDSVLGPDALLSRAVAQMALKKMTDAGRTIDMFVSRYKSSSKLNEAWFWKGILAAESSNHKEAENAFGKALELNIEGDMSDKARAYRALAIYRAGDTKRAAEELQRLTGKKETGYAGRNIFAWLVQYRLDLKDKDKSLDAAEKLLALSTAPVEKQEAFCLMGRSFELAAESAKAHASYLKAYGEKSSSSFKAEAALALGKAAAEAKDHDKAIKYFESAAKLSGEDDGIAVRARAYMGLGSVSEKTGSHVEAARFFMSVAILFDDEGIVPEALHSAARCYAAAEMPKKAAQVLSELKARYPKSSYAKEASGQ